MNIRKTLVAVPAVLALTLTACSSSGMQQSGSSTGQSQASASSSPVVLYGSEPQNPLIPADSGEEYGGNLINMLFSGLITFDKDLKPQNDVAESIDNKSNQVYTVKLKKGRKFSDGTEVKAHNFTDAWKLAAKTPMALASFYSPIEGTNESGTGDMSGVQVVDDYTFTIKLKQPSRDFLSRLGYVAFYPLPDSTLKDPKEGGEHPVGNGPYMPAGKDAWKHQAKFTAVPNPNYVGDHKAQNAGITFIFYTKPAAAYRDIQADNLDMMGVPQAQLTTYKNDFAGRIQERPSSSALAMTVPSYIPHFSGEEGVLRRQAISYSINRKEIGDTIYHGVYVPPKDFTAPTVPGYNDHIKGNEVLTFDPAKAKELWAKADAISPWSGKFTVAYTASGTPTMADALCNSIKNTLGINAEIFSYPDFKAQRDAAVNKKLTGATLGGWGADYPSQMNYLEPMYRTGGSSNDTGYSNPDFDKLLDKAQSASSDDEFNKILNQAQELLMRDLPSIPLFNAMGITIWSNNIKSFERTWNGSYDYPTIVKK